MDVGFKKGYFLLNNKKHVTRTGINLIGRNREATLIIKDTSISQHHALLVILDDGRHYLSDFNSSNGTFLDSARLQPLRLYEVRQGAQVQFAEIKSTYFKVTDVVEVNTQGSDSPRAADDTLFNADTQLIDGSIMSATLLENKTNGMNHVNDHGYSKLLDEEDAASTSNSLCVNHTNEVDTNTCADGSKSVEKVTDPMDDHGYHKKNQVTDIGGAPTPVETKAREWETIHDLPTQIVDKYDGDVRGSNSSIHELPTQLMDAKDMEDSNGEEVLKEKIVQKLGSSSIHELPTQMIRKANVLGVLDSKSTKDQIKLDYDQTHPATDESVLDTERNNTGDIIDVTLLVTSPKKQQSPSDTDGSSADSFDFMQSVSQHFADGAQSLDTNTQQSELHVSQRSKNIGNVIESDDETDDFKVTGMRRTKKRNIIDSSQETEANLAEGKTIKPGPVIRDSDSETDAEIDAPQGKDDKEGLPSNENTCKRGIKPVQADSDSETDVEIDISKEEKTNDGRDESTSNEAKTRLDSGRKNDIDDSDSDLELSKTGRTKKNVIESSDDTDAEDEKRAPVEFEWKLTGDDGGTKPMQADSETDVAIDISKEEKTNDGEDKSTSNEVKTIETRKNEIDDSDLDLELIKTVRTKKYVIESSDDTDAEDEEKAPVEFERKLTGDGGTKPVQADSETDVEIDISKEEKTNDVEDKSTSNEAKTVETRLDSGSKNEIDDSDLDSELIKTVRTKKYVIESSDDTDAEDEEKAPVQFERKLTGDGGTKPVQADSDSETDVEIEEKTNDGRDKSTSNEVKTGLDSGGKNEIDGSDLELVKTGRTKKYVIESSDDSDAEYEKKAPAEFERKLTGDGGAKPVQVDSDSETDVQVDISKDEKANDGQDKSNEVKTVETRFDSDSYLELTKSSRTKKNAIESSDDTDAEDETNKTEKQTKVSETDVVSDILSANEKTKINSQDKITSGFNSELIDVETDVAVASEESIGDRSQADLFTTTKIDEEIRDEDEPEKKSGNDGNADANSRLDDTDVIPATQSSFVGEIDFDFNTQDLNYAAAKLEKARGENPREKRDHTLNSEEALGDSFRLALSASIIEQPGREDSKNTDDLFLQATQKNTEDGIKSSENGNVFLKPTQNLDARNDGDDDDIYVQPTQQLSENLCGSEEILLQPQIIVTEKCLGKKSNDDSVFLKPTQKLAVDGNVEEKLEDIFRPTQPDDDSIFLEATQKFPEKKKQDQSTFLRPALVGDVVRKSKLQIQAEDNIFMQATQITPVDNVVNDKIEPNLSTNKKKVVDDEDIFMQATQLTPDVQKTTPIDKDVFLQATQVVTNDFKEDLPKTLPHSVESQLEVMFASQSVKLAEDENPQVQTETIEINDDLPEAASSKENERNVRSTDSNDDAPRRSSRRKSPQLSNAKVNVKNTRSTRSITKKLGDAPAAPSDEDKLDLLFKSTIIMENDILSESEEPVGRRTRRSSHSPDTLENNESSKSLRKKSIRTPLATVEERPESSSKLDVISTVSAGQQPKLQSKKRSVKITQIVDDVGEGTSGDNVEQDVKTGRSRRCRAKGDSEKGEEDINANHKTECTKVVSVDDETPHRSTRRTRNKTETAHCTSDSSNDFDGPIRSESPSVSRKTTRDKTVTKKTIEIKVSEECTAGTKSKKPKGVQKTDVKQNSKRTNCIADDEEMSTKRTRIDSVENENSSNNFTGSIESETPSTSRRTKSRRMRSILSTSDDEFAPSVTKKKKNVADVDDDDSEDVKARSSAKNIPGTPTRKKLLQLQGTPLSTPERLKRKLKPKVAFTMLDSPELESLIRSLGGSVVDTVDVCTVLVTGGVKRSQKLLSAVGLGKPICSPKWLQECRKAGSFVDPWDHILVDEEAENKWHFSLKESLHRSTETKLLENYTVHLIVNNAQDVLKGAIESCGGKCVTRAPPKNSASKYVIVSAQENKSKYAKFLKQTPRPVMVTAEAIFDGVLRQELRFEEHRLT